MYYAEYNDYVTQKYNTVQEAVSDMVHYMIENNITDEFRVYRTIHIDAKSIINPVCEADILELIKKHTREIYGEDATNYLNNIDSDAYNYFSYALSEYKKALTSWLINYHLEPTWERIAAILIYKYDEESKVWRYIREYVEPINPIEPSEEPIEPTVGD